MTPSKQSTELTPEQRHKKSVKMLRAKGRCPACRQLLALYGCTGKDEHGCLAQVKSDAQRLTERRQQVLAQQGEAEKQARAAYQQSKPSSPLRVPEHQWPKKLKLTPKQVEEFIKAIRDQADVPMADIALLSAAHPWTYEEWKGISDKSKQVGEYPDLRVRALEWLRMESLRLADQLGLFTESGLREFLRPARIDKNKQQAPYLKKLLKNRNETQRKANWLQFCDMHNLDRKLALRGHHHLLIDPETLGQRPLPYVAAGYSVAPAPRLQPIEELKVARLRTSRPGVGGHTDSSVFLPSPDDLVLDESKPRVPRIASNRRVISVDFDAPGLENEFKAYCKKVLKALGRQRSKRLKHCDLVHMWEAIQLYPEHKQNHRQPELHRVGKKAKSFGPPASDQQYERRGQDVVTLAEDMIVTALLPPHNTPWTRTFL